MKVLQTVFIIGLIMLIAACASLPKIVEGTTPNAANKKSTSTSTDVAKPGTTVKKPGGYYLDDGPADNAPHDIDSIQDAVPRVETPLVRANKPYTALGKSYIPKTGYEPFKQTGIASWYGKRYHGQRTSSGEIYDMFAMTAAHTILPLPSYLRVTNPANKKSVIVRVNDRGPFHSDRIVDLSYAAAYKLRLANTGSGYVEIESIDAATFKPTLAKSLDTEPSLITSATTNSISTSKNNTQYFVQAGAFKSDVNAQKLQARIESLGLANDIGIASALGKDSFYRVKLGPYNSRQDADSAASNIRKKLAITALVVNQ